MNSYKNIKTKLPGKIHNIVIDGRITRWDEALPTGNGLTGCLIWEDGDLLRLSLDRGDLWDTRAAEETLLENYTYKDLIDLVKQGKHEEIHKRYDNFYSDKPTPTKIPAGYITVGLGKNITGITNKVYLDRALAEVKLDAEDRNVLFNVFSHATDFVGHIRISGCKKKPDILLHNHGFSMKNQGDQDKTSLSQLDYPDAEYFTKGPLTWFIQKTKQDLIFSILLAVKKTADNVFEAVYHIAANTAGEKWLEEAKLKVLNALENSFERSLHAHMRWWHSYWRKSSISLPDKELEKLWYISNYIFASCSRKGSPPMPLQGVWTADEGVLPPWKGDYHHDLNTQMSYWHYLKANHLEEGENFIDFLWRLVPEARKFAKTFFDAHGLCLPSVMGIDGASLGGWVQYSTNLVNQDLALPGV